MILARGALSEGHVYGRVTGWKFKQVGGNTVVASLGLTFTVIS